jgi:tetratricopeptide (TPR) repeat protein
MKKKRIALFLVCCFNIVVCNMALSMGEISVNQFPDSLKTKYLKAKTSQNKIDIVNDCSFYLCNSNPELALTYSRYALRVADSIGYKKGLCEANLIAGIAFYRISRFQQALTCFSTAVDIARNLGLENKVAAIYSNMALVYNSLADYDKAQKYNFEALRIRTDLKDTSAIANSYNNIGLTYHNKSDYSSANQYYGIALRLKKALHDQAGAASTYNNIGQLFFEMYSDTSKWAVDSAQFYFLKAYFSWNNAGNKVEMAKVLLNIANIYAQKDDFNKAFDAYRAALNSQKQVNDSVGIALTYYNTALLYKEISDNKSAKEYAAQSLDIAKKLNLPDIERDDLRLLIECSGWEKDYSQAFRYTKEYLQLNDSLQELAHKRLIEEFKGKYEYRVFENLNLVKSVKASKSKLVILSILTFVVLLTFIVWIIRGNKKHNRTGS